MAVGARQRAHRHLRQAACRELLAQDATAAGQHPRGTLRVRQHHAEAACAQLGRGVDQAVEAVEGRLEQQPAPAVRADRDLVELGLGQARDHLRVELATGNHRERDPLGSKPFLEFRDTSRYLAGVCEELAADVRRGDDGACPVANCEPRQLQAFLHRCRSVVDARQDVEVNVCASRMDALHEDSIAAICRGFVKGM
jgi:hypothetical protein